MADIEDSGKLVSLCTAFLPLAPPLPMVMILWEALKTCLEPGAKLCIGEPAEGELAEQLIAVCLLIKYGFD